MLIFLCWFHLKPFHIDPFSDTEKAIFCNIIYTVISDFTNVYQIKYYTVVLSDKHVCNHGFGLLFSFRNKGYSVC